MNVIYIHCHDAGRMIEPYGVAVPTPNLMNLAKRSTLFRHAYAAAPTCSPSRAALLTGASPHTVGMVGLTRNAGKLEDPSQHLASYLASQGFETVLSGEQHETIDDVTSLGYQHVLNPGSAFGLDHINGRWEDIRDFDHQSAKSAADFITTRNEDAPPFFMSVGFFFPHRNYPPPAADIDPAYVSPPAPIWDTAATRQDMASHMTATRFMDDNVGIVMDALEAGSHARDTIVIFTVDHGPAFPAMKCTLTDRGIGVALMLSVPGLETVKVTDALVSQIDIFPTLCELLHLPVPDHLEGRSLVPVLTGQAEEVNDSVFAEISYHLSYEPTRAVRTRHHKLIRYFGDYEKTIWPNVDDSPSKRVLLDHPQQQQTRAKEILVDLVRDPFECENRRDDPQYEDVYTRLKQMLNDWMDRTGDPLLTGPVPRHQTGAYVLPPTALSPQSKPDDQA